MEPIVIISAARTPQGHLLGIFKEVSAVTLGSHAIRAALERAQLSPQHINATLMGCVLPAGQGQAPARQAAKHANIPDHVPATTINKMCGSGMQAVMFAHDTLCAGSHDMIVAGGMESMTQAPYLIPHARNGYRLGHGELIDHMCRDGLEDAYDKGHLMGYFADATAKKYKISREQQDEFAIASLKRAHTAQQNGAFAAEITPVTYTTRKGDITINEDELPPLKNIEKIPHLKPAFNKDGTVTAANASSISDGAAALVLTRQSIAEKLNITPLATLVAHASYAQAPAWFTTAPVGAIQHVLKKAHWNIEDVDLWEINEAFAVVTLAAMHDLKLPHDRVNIHGGACALGHPIGASGARIIATLIYALKQQQKQRGVAALCIGGGEATAVAIELTH